MTFIILLGTITEISYVVYHTDVLTEMHLL